MAAAGIVVKLSATTPQAGAEVIQRCRHCGKRGEIINAGSNDRQHADDKHQRIGGENFPHRLVNAPGSARLPNLMV